eukprot:CAMPEP_0117492850 /NCGR_PEP_ID=MMETSP0784-20121206/18796_1 /TAXON_ID=39447 /ORGANISM="" /LENGTH=96 /DNA_ID=CAMNT_0005287687 /DNA_START=8 /DNA_END=295 /DNA_ORIENTATION=+
MALRGQSRLLAAVFLAALFAGTYFSPAFVAGGASAAATATPPLRGAPAAVVAGMPAAAFLTTPIAANAVEDFPTPVLGIGMLSVVVVIVLVVSAIA